MFRRAIFSKLDIIEIGHFRKMRFSDLDMSQNDTPAGRFLGLEKRQEKENVRPGSRAIASYSDESNSMHKIWAS